MQDPPAAMPALGSLASDVALTQPPPRCEEPVPSCSGFGQVPLIYLGVPGSAACILLAWQAARVSDGGDSLLEGLYESLITRALEKRLAGLSTLDVQRGVIDEADEPDVMARHVRDVTL